MEKIININFQGRIIPIEETAYNALKQYTDSLRNHFAGEESSDEIINDIENRIAELLGYRLKQGATCITLTDIKTVIDSIGRLEDIEAAEEDPLAAPQNKSSTANSYQKGQSAPRGRFYRNADDKVIAGVCSGIGNRMGIDPVVVRLLFVLLFGALFWIYILLWIIVPSQSITASVTRRLYRNPDDKVIAGVCGGLAVYFRISPRTMRLIFVLPVILGILSRGMLLLWWHWHWWGLGPRIVFGSFGSTLFIIYVVLWIALPYARSATDILEMRGEKIDMNSIKAASQAKMNTAYNRPATSGLGRVIGILFKAFFLFIAGTIALSLFGVLIGLAFASFWAIPVTGLVLNSWGESALAWCGIMLVCGIPFLALITWLVRRLIGARSHRHYLGYVFAGLWVVGLVVVIASAATLFSKFNYTATVEDTCPIAQPSGNKLYVSVQDDSRVHAYNNAWWRGNNSWKTTPFFTPHDDSFWVNTIKVTVTQSKDSLFHLYETRVSHGPTQQSAKDLASHIPFSITQQDSMLILPAGFEINNKDKFRNQQVILTIEAPVGKEVRLGDDVDDYSWFNINTDHGNMFFEGNMHRRRWHWRHNAYGTGSGNYEITTSGLKKTQDTSGTNREDDDDNDN